MDAINMLALAIIIACSGLVFVVLRAFVLVYTVQIQTRLCKLSDVAPTVPIRIAFVHGDRVFIFH